MSTSPPAAEAKRISAFAVVLLVLLMGVSVYFTSRRLSHSLDSDELFHALAARTLLQEGNLALAPHLEREYTRARLTTYLVAASFWLFGESEVAARLPSVAFTVLFLPLIFLVGRSMFRTSLGLWAAGLAAFFPFFYVQARLCRMYPHARFFALLTFFLLFLVLDRLHRATREGRGWPDAFRWARSPRGALTVIAAAASLGLAFHFHIVTLVMGAGIGLYVVYLALLELRECGPKRALSSPIFVLLIVCTAAAAAFVFGTEYGYKTVTGPFTHLAGWTTEKDTRPLIYHRALREQGRLLYALFPMGAILALARGRRNGIYCALVFGVTLALMSFGFRWKQMRFLSVHLGVYLLLVALAADIAARSIRRALAEDLPARLQWAATPLVAAGVLGAWLFAGIPQLVPYAIHKPRYTQREAYRYVDEHRRPGDAVVARLERAALFYIGSDNSYPLYKLQTDEAKTQGWIPKEILTVDELQAVVERHGRAWVIAEKADVTIEHTHLRLIAGPMRELLQSLEPVYESPEQSVVVFRIDDPKTVKP
jgi:4-amino-4-deoxy-L-arabinose transferase-like glycosyltransferase